MKQIFLFCGYASKQQQNWRIKLKGWACEYTNNSTRTKVIKSVSRRVLSPLGLSEQTKQVFSERTSGFTANSLVCTICISAVDVIETTTFTDMNEFDHEWLDEKKYHHIQVTTDQNGLFEGELNVLEDFAEKFTAHRPSIRLAAYILDDTEIFDIQPFEMIPPEGLSIISDVDDTIKHSDVYKGLYSTLKTALFHDLKDVPGMADSYLLLFAKGCCFHYVSGGPFQFIPVVDLFLHKFHFPQGSLMLRNTREVDTVAYKQQVILDILHDFPNRKFVLVGDSGEKDAEIYAFVKDQVSNVAGIFIRQVSPQETVDREITDYILFNDPTDLLSVREM